MKKEKKNKYINEWKEVKWGDIKIKMKENKSV